MRSCLIILLLIAATVSVAMQIDGRSDGPTTVGLREEKVWVRTAAGWESLRHVQAMTQEPAARHEPALHPFTIAGLQTLGSLLVLLAFDRRKSATDAVEKQQP